MPSASTAVPAKRGADNNNDINANPIPCARLKSAGEAQQNNNKKRDRFLLKFA